MAPDFMLHAALNELKLEGVGGGGREVRSELLEAQHRALVHDGSGT